MAAIFRKRADGRRLDAETLEQMAGQHLLLLPNDTATPELVATLVRSRLDEAELELTGTARAGRQSSITGPRPLSDEDGASLGAPEGLRAAYRLVAPVERDADGFDAFVDPLQMALWMRAFPTGPPYREEGDLVGLGLDLARRLGGALRVGGTGVLMTPDPTRDVELTVWSPYWMEATDLVALLEPVLPGARLDIGRPHDDVPEPAPPGERPWSVDPLDPLAEDLEAALTPALLRRLEGVAEATDAWAAKEMAVADGYAVVGHGGIVVGVQVETRVPHWVLRQLSDLPEVPSDRLVTYDIRWWPQDVGQLHLENPTTAHRIARRIVAETIRAVGRVTSEAVYGVVVDAAGFHVRPEDLR
jgi:hypothetical protein